MSTKTKKIWISILSIFLVVVIIVSAFFIGRFSMSNAGDTYAWIWETASKNYYKELDEAQFLQDYNEGGITQALDIYSEYYTKSQYAAQYATNSGSRSGYGISYSYVTGYPVTQDSFADGILLNTVIGNSPAYYSGLRAGTIIKSGIYGSQTVNFTSRSDFNSFLSSKSESDQVTLVDISGNSYTLSRSDYTSSYTFYASRDTSWHFESSDSGSLTAVENANEQYSFLPEGFGYISVSQFFGTAASEVGILISKFNEEMNLRGDSVTKTLILDLRNNGGGYVSSMQDMSGYFLANVMGASSVAMVARYRDGSTTSFPVSSHSGKTCLQEGTNLYVLANSSTASASEALIGVLVCSGLVDYSHIYISNYGSAYLNWYVSLSGGTTSSVKNARTYGKGIMQSTFTNALTGEALKLTTAEIFWPDETTSIHDRGLSAADNCKIVDAEWTVTAGDRELQTVVADIIGS